MNMKLTYVLHYILGGVDLEIERDFSTGQVKINDNFSNVRLRLSLSRDLIEPS